MSSLLILSESISTGQKRWRGSMGRTKERSAGTWMKGGCPCYSSWIFCSRITSPTLLCTHHPQVCHDHGSSLGQWNLVEVICHFQVKRLESDPNLPHTPFLWSRRSLHPLCFLKGCDEEGPLSTKVRCEWEIKLSYAETFRFGGFMSS